MKTLIIDKKDILFKIENEAIKIDKSSIPLKHLDMVLLNHRVTLSTADILKLTKSDISILILSHQSKNLSLIHSANAKNAHTKEAQYTALLNRVNIAKYFISQKIITHTNHLNQNKRYIEHTNYLTKLQNATSIDEILGIEGAFSRLYFGEFFSLLPKELHNNKRTKNPPQDPANALMSYIYMLYYYIITAKLLSHGFESSIGYLHTPFRDHNALSSDILELFRAELNQIVLKILTSNTLAKEDFTKNRGVYLRYEGRKKIWEIFLELTAILKPKLDHEIANLKRMINDETASDYQEL